MTCPFCNDDDFDAAGLKYHLSAGLCGSYNTTPGLTRRAHRLEANVPPKASAADVGRAVANKLLGEPRG